MNGIEEIEPIEEMEQTNIEDILEIVKVGGTELLTVEESQEYSDYRDEQFVSTNKNDHNANLVDHIAEDEQSWLYRLANDVTEWVENDLDSRKDWLTKETRGISLLGVTTTTVGGGDFKGASRVTHPLLIEACTQFQARAIAEMWPSEGPVKSVVVGETNDQLMEQAERVTNYMNYQYMHQMPGAFEEEDKMLFRLPISGSCFKKTVYDPIEGSLVSKFIESSVMIVPYSATSLRTAIRYTEKFEETGNDTNKKIAAGVYRKDVDLTGRDYGSTENTSVEDIIDEAEGRAFVEYEGDHAYIRYECYCYLDIPGFEDKDMDGNRTNVELPYVVTVDYDNEQVLAIRRNWKKGDVKKKRRVFYTHYRFLPGLGFYGYGLIHAIGGLAESATGALRSLLDAAGFSNTKGGYRSRDAKIKGGDVPIGMGEWREVDSTAEELASAFFPLPYSEPSETLFRLLGMLDDLGRRFASTTENMVGDANNTGPVGTTLALIEQGSKVFSAIHLRLHHGHEEEYKLLGSLNADYLPYDYPYMVPGGDRYIKSSDFDDRIDVIPVSDPNTISDTQRISRQQGVMQLETQAPELYDKRVVHKGMLTAMRVSNIDEIMPPQEEIMPADPVTEMSNIIKSVPVMAFVDQDHQAHIAVHEQIFSTLSKDEQEVLGGQYYAHIAEHKAFDLVLAFEELIGAQITPENMEQATQASAMVAQMYVDETGLGEDTDEAMQQGQEKRKNAETMGKIKRDDLSMSADIRRKDDAAAAEIERQAGREVTAAISEATAVLGVDKEG